MDDPIRSRSDPAGDDSKGAVEDDVERIREIKGDEVLGYLGEGREEVTGSEEATGQLDAEDALADNEPEQLSPNVKESLDDEKRRSER